MSGFRHKCICRESLVGSFAAIPHPVAVEVMAQSGLDFLCIDWEHAQISRDMIEAMVRAADIHRVPAIVRVPGHAPEAIAAALDSGAQGVLVPRVSTAAQAQAAVKASRYPPTGERGVGPGRAAGYGYRISEYLAQANDSIVVAVQVETSEGLANIEAIAAVEGVDVTFVGPGDLSVSIDAIGPKGADKLAQAIHRIIDVTIAHGRTSGIFCARPQDVAQWATLGASFFILASDTMFLGAGAAAGKAGADVELGGSGRS
ncbi:MULTISPECIES: HpcH/HpaI aldolase/citrate lyase family protein [unclassified Mesorhizobium]|uniref:HpcH/HpaI aldolase family protein n=1 Tax=unclassified Mesorhizobium TaxID=325217 RepID=UPI001128A247|nr:MULTISPECIES: HpcH/HpaI aldolase/citrate lyase family protein [unclassified Mesorhizobium]TPI52990.1 HpcH/HpaI aldolase/citrate lyase family protein [Mesorhizobium sp. B3-1-1]TPJ71016.1 HpcH/HpaI aldolase/citrate lyase family protein [Mesorhizobium sp. B2-6-7]TPJ85799.1 HpcH/HpaI aldolase/citrate lyase family protein [Mesorhizobium sp. B2-6-3]TPJ99667.1 HpcH/HpaI aldolase/citrate lyase family protein [Mesorhizobium sp. B2-5-10]TPK07756.1 HpcH/HpaI aldolase/citrate lyase family protein [Meso